MDIQSLNNTAMMNAYNSDAKKVDNQEDDINIKVSKNEPISQQDRSFHNLAVDLSISMESIKVFINLKSVEMTKDNTSAQSAIHSLQQKSAEQGLVLKDEVYDFLSGKEMGNGLSLSSIGYNGKPITELNQSEAKELVSENGFFGVTQTAQRVSSFVVGLANGNVEALQEARHGIIQGFEEAEDMWGGELPAISYETQEKTLEIVDAKIAELLKTDAQKELE